jgi:hypothetical protein
MTTKRLASTALAAIALAMPANVLAAPANADPDTDFVNELHIYGIYGPKDYNAWIGKITCKRLYNGVDADAYKSAQFVLQQLPKGSNTEQAYQFLGAALRTYCPEKMSILQQVAGQPPAAQPAPAGPPLAAEGSQ